MRVVGPWEDMVDTGPLRPYEEIDLGMWCMCVLLGDSETGCECNLDGESIFFLFHDRQLCSALPASIQLGLIGYKSSNCEADAPA